MNRREFLEFAAALGVAGFAPDMPAGTPCWLYLERAGGEEAVLKVTRLKPCYGLADRPEAPEDGQHWFNVSDLRMYQWDGGRWQPRDIVFIGESAEVFDAS